MKKDAMIYIEARAIAMGIKNIKEWVNIWLEEYNELTDNQKEQFWELYKSKFQIDNILWEVKNNY